LEHSASVVMSVGSLALRTDWPVMLHHSHHPVGVTPQFWCPAD